MSHIKMTDSKSVEYDPQFPYTPMQLYCAYTSATIPLIEKAIGDVTGGYHLIRCDQDYDEEGNPVESNRVIIGLLPADYAKVARDYGTKKKDGLFWIVNFRMSEQHYPKKDKHDEKIVVYIPEDVPYSVVFGKLRETVTMFFGRPDGFSVQLPVHPDNGRLRDKHQKQGYISIQDSAALSLDDLVRLRVFLNNFVFTWGKEDEHYCRLNTAWYFMRTNAERIEKQKTAGGHHRGGYNGARRNFKQAGPSAAPAPAPAPVKTENPFEALSEPAASPEEKKE
jgi:hypothetical protein